MNKRFSFSLLIILLLTATLSAQTISDTFSTIRPWRVGYGNWAIEGGRLVQNNTRTGLARIDREIPRHDGIVDIEFDVLYKDGGYHSEADLQAGRYHGGFGIHIGVQNPALGKMAWGNGRSYLLWLNLDTRPETLRQYPVHFGFRAQIYESKSNTSMDLVRMPELKELIGTDAMSLDIVAALRDAGIMVSIDDIGNYLGYTVPIKMEVNTRTGDIWVKDPTADLWYWLYLDPAKLKGNYVSFRTNGLALSFDNFKVSLR